ncbi:hypothetical protein [Tsuneonella suprasediminis]|uniref:hypothetical protein n=1 Tax=Tsuneonella suprasediminis TaxID=2306996 RepID=UPI002F9422E8
MIVRSAIAGVFVSTTFMLAACGNGNLLAYERKGFSVCYADGGAWAGEGIAARYIEDGFHDLERHFSPFLNDVEQAAAKAASEPRANWPVRFAPLHNEMQANIVRLGRLFPRMRRPLDLAPMAAQLEEGRIWWPRGDHHTEYLAVALSEEFADHQNLGHHVAIFLSSLERVEAMLLDLRYDETDDPASDLSSPQDLADAVRQLRESWEDGARPGMMQVIFDRPDIPENETLSRRLQTRVMAICKSGSTCSGDGSGNCAGATSNGLTGEPMDIGL